MTVCSASAPDQLGVRVRALLGPRLPSPSSKARHACCATTNHRCAPKVVLAWCRRVAITFKAAVSRKPLASVRCLAGAVGECSAPNGPALHPHRKECCSRGHVAVVLPSLARVTGTPPMLDAGVLLLTSCVAPRVACSTSKAPRKGRREQSPHQLLLFILRRNGT